MSELIKLFGNNLRVLRLRAGLTQEQLAFKAGLHRTYMGSVERGERNVSLKNVEKIAEALGIQPSTLLSELDEKK